MTYSTDHWTWNFRISKPFVKILETHGDIDKKPSKIIYKYRKQSEQTILKSIILV